MSLIPTSFRFEYIEQISIEELNICLIICFNDADIANVLTQPLLVLCKNVDTPLMSTVIPSGWPCNVEQNVNFLKLDCERLHL